MIEAASGQYKGTVPVPYGREPTVPGTWYVRTTFIQFKFLL